MAGGPLRLQVSKGARERRPRRGGDDSSWSASWGRRRRMTATTKTGAARRWQNGARGWPRRRRRRHRPAWLRSSAARREMMAMVTRGGGGRRWGAGSDGARPGRLRRWWWWLWLVWRPRGRELPSPQQGDLVKSLVGVRNTVPKGSANDALIDRDLRCVPRIFHFPPSSVAPLSKTPARSLRECATQPSTPV